MVVIGVEAAVAAVGLWMGTSQPQDYSVCLSRCITKDTAQRREMVCRQNTQHSILLQTRWKVLQRRAQMQAASDALVQYEETFLAMHSKLDLNNATAVVKRFLDR